MKSRKQPDPNLIKNAFSYCADSVKKRDYENYLSLMLMPKEKQPRILAVSSYFRLLNIQPIPDSCIQCRSFNYQAENQEKLWSDWDISASILEGCFEYSLRRCQRTHSKVSIWIYIAILISANICLC